MPFTVTLPAAIKVSASRLEQTPELAIYRFNRIFPGSVVEAFELPVGLGRYGFRFAGSYGPDLAESGDLLLKVSDFEESEPREVEPLESEDLEDELRVAEPLGSLPREAEPLESEDLEDEPLESGVLKSDPLEPAPLDDR